MTTRVKSTSSGSPAIASTHRDVFEQMAVYAHEQVSFWYDPESGYRGIIAIHNTALGPALGGTRFWKYTNDAEALFDVLRLARGMTYKAAVAGLDLGGGKSVIIGDNKTKQREGIFRAHGRHVESLAGRYITAEDVGTGTRDMEYIREETTHVVGLAERSGDPSPVTAWGTYRGMQACAKYRYDLCESLHKDGAKLVVTDIDPQRVKRVVDDFGATAVASDEIYTQKADIFAPCALGAVINDKTLDLLKVDVVAGAANNQLARAEHGDALKERGILYAPDYAINAGGLINVYGEINEWSAQAFARSFYDHFAAGHPLAAAVVQAQETLRAETPDPFLWAPHAFFGDWR